MTVLIQSILLVDYGIRAGITQQVSDGLSNNDVPYKIALSTQRHTLPPPFFTQNKLCIIRCFKAQEAHMVPLLSGLYAGLPLRKMGFA